MYYYYCPRVCVSCHSSTPIDRHYIINEHNIHPQLQDCLPRHSRSMTPRGRWSLGCSLLGIGANSLLFRPARRSPQRTGGTIMAATSTPSPHHTWSIQPLNSSVLVVKRGWNGLKAGTSMKGCLSDGKGHTSGPIRGFGLPLSPRRRLQLSGCWGWLLSRRPLLKNSKGPVGTPVTPTLLLP